MFRLLLAALVAIATGVLAYQLPDLDVALLGEANRGYFVFHSAALPVVLLFVNSWLEDSGLLTRLFGVTVGVGVSFGTAARLGVELFSEAPRIVYPIAGAVLTDTLADERAWLLANGLVALMVAFATFAAGTDQPDTEDDD